MCVAVMCHVPEDLARVNSRPLVPVVGAPPNLVSARCCSVHAADALALAITHIWRGGAQARIDAALAAAQGRSR